MDLFTLQYVSGKSKNYTYNILWDFGDFYGGRRHSLFSEVDYIFNKRFSSNVVVDYNRMKFPLKYSANGNRVETQTVISGRLNYNISSTLSIATLLQYDEKGESFGSNICLRYNPAEGRDLYVVFNQELNTTRYHYSPVKPLTQSQAIIFKYSHTIIRWAHGDINQRILKFVLRMDVVRYKN